VKILTIVVVALTALPLTAVAEIDGRTIRVTGDSPAIPSPVYLAIDGEAPAGRVTLSDTSGNSLPATVLGNYLVFLPQEPGDYKVSISRRSPRAEVRIEENSKTGALEVRFGRDLFTAFYHSPEDGKPALWPIRGEGGVSLTRDWPFGEPDVTRDHPHQKSFWTGYGNINGADYWEYGRRTGNRSCRTSTMPPAKRSDISSPTSRGSTSRALRCSTNAAK
jgi:hypothetical protein